MKYRITNIVYDLSTESEKKLDLPKTMVLDADEPDGSEELESELGELISTQTGWCVYSFNYVPAYRQGGADTPLDTPCLDDSFHRHEMDV